MSCGYLSIFQDWQYSFQDWQYIFQDLEYYFCRGTNFCLLAHTNYKVTIVVLTALQINST